MNGLIIEGVAGTGKSTIVAALRQSLATKQLKVSYDIIYEEQTTGELVAELRDERLSDSDRYSRLNDLMPSIQKRQLAGEFLILERFHPTFFALMPQSSLFEKFDFQLSELNFGLVLLDLPNDEFANRSFSRPEMESQNWSEGLIEWYGSRDAAIDAFINSQERRRQFLSLTKLKSLKIDTSNREWNKYVDSITKFIAD